jgi:hypothetical protein
MPLFHKYMEDTQGMGSSQRLWISVYTIQQRTVNIWVCDKEKGLWIAMGSNLGKGQELEDKK